MRGCLPVLHRSPLGGAIVTVGTDGQRDGGCGGCQYDGVADYQTDRRRGQLYGGAEDCQLRVAGQIGEESLSTIDITAIDLYTGQAHFYKAGAAPTFVRRGNRAGMVESTSLPVGILTAVEFEKAASSCRMGIWW